MRIFCVHQGYELYGSDRSFIASVSALRTLFPEAHICVIVPRDGPIVPLLRSFANDVIIEPLWVLRRRHVGRLAVVGWITLLPAVRRALARFEQSSLVYINTVAILDYLIAARFYRQKALLHIHELPTGFTAMVLRRLVRTAGVAIIFNSMATRQAFNFPQEIRSYILYNGFEGPEKFSLSTYDGTRPLRLLMLGRVSDWKGQDLLITSCSRLPPTARTRVEVRIIGSSFDSNKKLEASFRHMSAELGCSDVIRFEAFVENPRDCYEWCDFVVVPSKVPEPLGRIPIEAMAYGRGSIVAAHGGLIETVEHGKTGWHVPPNDPDALAATIIYAMREPTHAQSFGLAGRQRYEQLFRQELIDKQFQDIVRNETRYEA